MIKKILIPEIRKIKKKSGISIKKINVFLGVLSHAQKPAVKMIRVTEAKMTKTYKVVRNGVGVITTKFGKFWQYNFIINDKWQNYSVIVKAGINPKTLKPHFKNTKRLMVRVDSGCESGRIFGDVTCDCVKQMQLSLKKIAGAGGGIIISIPHQDGRGMGLGFKLATLWAQDFLKINTIEAASLVAAGNNFDTRTYEGVIAILKFFDIKTGSELVITTSNPDKANIFTKNGYIVRNQIPIKIRPNKHTRQHLLAKKKYFGRKNIIKK